MNEPDPVAAEQMARAEAALEALHALPDDPTRETALATVQALVEFHARGLEQIVAHAGDTVTEQLAGDPLVAGLLGLHALRPAAGQERALRELEQLLPSCRDRAGLDHAQLAADEPPDELAEAPRLTAVAKQVRSDAQEQLERCELCGEAIAVQHRHVVDLRDGTLKCACRACAILFDRDGAHSGHLRAVGDRRLALEDLALDDTRWAQLGVPVDMAFFTRSSTDGRVRVMYPSPAGVTEATFDATGWLDDLAATDERMALLRDDTEALLVDRIRDRRRHWIVPIDDAYRLVTLVRSHWRGFTGGRDVWERLDEFFDELAKTARPAPAGGNPRTDERQATWA